ncbi:MAG: ArsR family transcriptional regulator [Oligoflexia bacterium]|nr:ArsR family transcriptional regulator [Oligoflexia bacterium]MBF0366155.1 ArsR family transcriptional regulator [Oligoflexia bacterium]
MIEKLFGNETAGLILLNIFHYEKIHASAISANISKALRPVLNQLQKLEDIGLLVSQEIGRTRLYFFNPKSPYTKPVKEIMQITYEAMPILLKEKMFHRRGRPRAKNKVVIRKKARV